MRTLSFWLVELGLSHRSVHNLTRLALTILNRYNYALLRTLHNETQKHFFVTLTMYVKHDQYYFISLFILDMQVCRVKNKSLMNIQWAHLRLRNIYLYHYRLGRLGGIHWF